MQYERPTSTLSSPIRLEAAQGWIDLGNGREASEELDQFAPVLRAHADLLKVRWEVCAQAKQWKVGFEIANAVAAKRPRESFGVIYAAYALCQLERTQAAHDLLSGVVEQFPKDQAIRYHLACYCCQLGKLKEAMEHLERAIDLAGYEIRVRALNDPALEPLWEYQRDLSTMSECRVPEIACYNKKAPDCSGGCVLGQKSIC